MIVCDELLQIASPSAHVFIAPDGPISVPSCVDQLQHTPYIYSGCSFPCQSVRLLDFVLAPPALISRVPCVWSGQVSSDVLKSASLAIGQQLYSMGVIGYATIDFAAHPVCLCPPFSTASFLSISLVFDDV